MTNFITLAIGIGMGAIMGFIIACIAFDVLKERKK